MSFSGKMKQFESKTQGTRTDAPANVKAPVQTYAGTRTDAPANVKAPVQTYAGTSAFPKGPVNVGAQNHSPCSTQILNMSFAEKVKQFEPNVHANVGAPTQGTRAFLKGPVNVGAPNQIQVGAQTQVGGASPHTKGSTIVLPNMSDLLSLINSADSSMEPTEIYSHIILYAIACYYEGVIDGLTHCEKTPRMEKIAIVIKMIFSVMNMILSPEKINECDTMEKTISQYTHGNKNTLNTLIIKCDEFCKTLLQSQEDCSPEGDHSEFIKLLLMQKKFNL